MSLERYRWALERPFPVEVVEVKPGAVSEAKGSALALLYVDARHYQRRLDDLFGPGKWNVEYQPWGERAVICRLTILEVVKEDVGEAEKGDPNQATSAAMQAFKRACTAFGLGRYLYTAFPQRWYPAEQKGRSWVIQEPARVVADLYLAAGLELGVQRGRYVHRLISLLEGLPEERIKAVGACAAEQLRQVEDEAEQKRLAINAQEDI